MASATETARSRTISPAAVKQVG